MAAHEDAPRSRETAGDRAARAGKAAVSGADLRDLARLVQAAPSFPELLAALKNGRSGTIDGAWGSAGPLAVAALAATAPGPVLVVMAHVGDVDDFADDLATFSGQKPEILPCPERIGKEGTGFDESLGRRLRVVRGLASEGGTKLVVCSIQALMRPIPRPAALDRSTRLLKTGDQVPVEELAGWLVANGFTRAEVAEVPGEFGQRGGILDVFPVDSPEPYRLEFFGDEIESIRTFDPETQRSSGAVDRVAILAPSALAGAVGGEEGSPADYLPDDAWVALIEPNDLKIEGNLYLERVPDRRGVYPVAAVFAKLLKRPSVTLSTISAGSLEKLCRLRVESVERFSGELSKVRNELEAATSGGEKVWIACHNEAEAERLAEVFADTDLGRSGRLSLPVGRVRAGFRLVDRKLVVLGDHELFARADVRRPTSRRRYESRAIDSFLDLNEGDLVVHINHGIAIYRGLQVVDKGGQAGFAEEQMVLEFAEGTRLYVPVAKVDLVQKYVGGGRTNPPLSRIGTSTWEKRKKRVAEALVDLASELIDIQAKRASQPGEAFPAEDSHWMTEFEAAFPYEATPDQASAIESIKDDLARPRPMDRLVCGDVGYGKTEVAMRAAFKVVDGGKQVAVLVPTTVLAEQHHRSFTARMAEFPFTIEVINRFRSKAHIKDVLRRTAEGQVDVLIGTHRIVQKDVIFKELGLVVIDEEQRFGVEDKEWLKNLRATVDVLTLSATPIPRTLHMSLLGIRDISNLETPPPDRKAIETRITRWDDELIRQAIFRELNRGGQVYFVHNRVHDIQHVADRLQALVPDARIVIGHGQMHGEQLEKVMLSFVRHEADILVATTIIESGLDIPNVNTIFIDEADIYGLADLHQLRGRVGRYKHRAYSYLILDPSKTITDNAVKRLKAIEEFTELGAGFKIALRDLEIRGAGNILGAEQSGHIEAVGYELFCSLLESAVRALTGKGEAPKFDCSIELAWRAYLPADYVPGSKLKVELYRRLGRVRSVERLADFRQELVDRFGPLPEPADHLLAEAELRVLASKWKLARIHVEDVYAVLTYRDPKKIESLAKRHPGKVRIVDERAAYVPLGDERPPVPQIASLLRDLMSPLAPKPAPPVQPPAPVLAKKTSVAPAAAKKVPPTEVPTPVRKALPVPVQKVVPARNGVRRRGGAKG